MFKDITLINAAEINLYEAVIRILLALAYFKFTSPMELCSLKEDSLFKYSLLSCT